MGADEVSSCRLIPRIFATTRLFFFSFQFIDYTKQPLATYLGENPPTTPYDVILEAVGMADNSLYTHCEKYLAPEGIYLSVKPQPNKWSDASKLGRLAFDVIVPGCYGGVNRKFAYVCTIF